MGGKKASPNVAENVSGWGVGVPSYVTHGAEFGGRAEAW